jgi:predicted amidophosphoribosyltransferase
MEILQFLGRFLNTLFPEKCVICKKGLNAICDDCKEKIIPITWQCLKCGYPSKKNHVPFCENCLLEEVVPDLIISLFTYEKISPVIINLKEKGSLKAKKALKELLEKYLPKKLEIMDYLSPA